MLSWNYHYYSLLIIKIIIIIVMKLLINHEIMFILSELKKKYNLISDYCQNIFFSMLKFLIYSKWSIVAMIILRTIFQKCVCRTLKSFLWLWVYVNACFVSWWKMKTLVSVKITTIWSVSVLTAEFSDIFLILLKVLLLSLNNIFLCLIWFIIESAKFIFCILFTILNVY